MTVTIPLLRRVIFSLTSSDPEYAHDLAIRYLTLKDQLVRVPTERSPTEVSVMGLTFPGPIGLAAGFNKNGYAIHRALRAEGFGFAEVGTVTPQPQKGNDRPRIRRHIAQQMLQNRMGFPNDGAHVVASRLVGYGPFPFPIGVNIGPNKASVSSVDLVCADLLSLVETFCGRCDYFVVNASSPNTPGLRALQTSGALTTMLTETVGCVKSRAMSLGIPVPPVLVKVSPDLSNQELADVCATASECDAAGIVMANTRMNYAWVSDDPSVKKFGGGLSGPPLFERVAQMVRFVKAHFSHLVIIAVGGIDSSACVAKLQRCGADLIQVYTSWVYGGRRLVQELNSAWRPA